MNRLVLLLLITFLTHSLSAQTTFTKRIDLATDDYEEYIDGAKLGQYDEGSSDLEMTTEGNGTQIIGLRFTGVTIPQGAVIESAYIQFTPDETNAEPTSLVFHGVAEDNALPIDGVNKISTRTRTLLSAAWNTIPAWTADETVGAAHTSSDLTAIVMEIVHRSGWASGNAMMFVVSGTGKRVADSYDGSPEKAPQLIISYKTSTTFSKRIDGSTDDNEEYIDGAKLGQFDEGSSDLEMTTEGGGTQVIGLRFTGVTLPPGATIENAYIQFTPDETNAEPTSLTFHGVAEDNALPIDGTNKISTRTKTTASTAWNTIPAWTADETIGAAHISPNLKTIVEEINGRSGWASGNAMMFIVSGTGKRVADSYDGSPEKAPQLIIVYSASTSSTFSKRIDGGTDDYEEYIDGAKIGQFDEGSSDLEMTTEGGGTQVIGLRFTGVAVAKGATIKNAYIEFTPDETNAEPTSLTLHGVAEDNALPIDLTNTISTRTKTTAIAAWNAIPAWTADETIGDAHRTPDLKTVVTEIIARNGWASGNAMMFIVSGTGKRVADSYDGSPEKAPKLVIVYEGEGPSPGNPVTAFPLKKKTAWSYSDKGSEPAPNWNMPAYSDASWPFGAAPMGFGAQGVGTQVASGVTTAYFRKQITIPEVSALTNSLTLNLLVDDGAIVYVNGVEVARRNMAAGTATYATLATKDVDGTAEGVYFYYEIPRSHFVNGVNVIAVEVHQSSTTSDDLIFDAELKDGTSPVNAPALGCSNASHFGCFTSVLPALQDPTIHLPASHTFQLLFGSGDAHTVGGGTVGNDNDFTGFVPNNGSSTLGVLNVNHETEPGGVTSADIQYNETTKLWSVVNTQKVDFSSVVATQSNCAGGVTPWGTSVTCEETTDAGDANSDGYQDFGWNVEIDPVTKAVREYNGVKQKLWAMGRMAHEGVCFHSDKKTAYYAEDEPSGSMYKFVATNPENMTEGELFALKLDQPLSGGDPTGTTGTWVKIPNTTQTERNTTPELAIGLGCTAFAGPEEMEISPIDGKVYATSKGHGRIYRFTDNGTTVSGFETFVGGKAYNINAGAEGIVNEPWGGGNDNLVFDELGNLYVLQDGSSNHVWMVRPDHTQATPKVELFMRTPTGSEPTGATFTPDHKFMFISIQAPSASNNIPLMDASGKSVVFNRAVTLVVARKEHLGTTGSVGHPSVNAQPKFNLAATPNPFVNELRVLFTLDRSSNVLLRVLDASGREVERLAGGVREAGDHCVTFVSQMLVRGVYFIQLVVDGEVVTLKTIAE